MAQAVTDQALIERLNSASGGVTLDDPFVLAIRAAEDSGDNQVSPKGATTSMQVMPATARDPGYGVAPAKDPNDPLERIRVGSDYAKAMLKRYGGDQELAAIAYNAGPAIADAYKNGGTLPAETKAYVPKVLGYLRGSQADNSAAGLGAPVTDQALIDRLDAADDEQGGFVHELARSFKGAVLGTDPYNSAKALEAIGGATGAKGMEDWGRSLSVYGEAAATRQNARVGSFHDIRTDSVGNFLADARDYSAAMLGQGAGTMLPPLAGGAAGGLVAGPVGAALGAGGPSYLINTGDVYTQLEQELAPKLKTGEITRRDIQEISVLAGIPISALDVVSLGRITAPIKGAAIKGIVKAMMNDGGIEGATEALQQVIQESVGAYLGGNATMMQRFQNIVDAGLGGMITGGVVGGGTHAVGSLTGGHGTPEETPPPGYGSAPGPAVPPSAVDPNTGISIVAPPTVDEAGNVETGEAGAPMPGPLPGTSIQGESAAQPPGIAAPASGPSAAVGLDTAPVAPVPGRGELLTSSPLPGTEIAQTPPAGPVPGVVTPVAAQPTVPAGAVTAPPGATAPAGPLLPVGSTVRVTRGNQLGVGRVFEARRISAPAKDANPNYYEVRFPDGRSARGWATQLGIEPVVAAPANTPLVSPELAAQLDAIAQPAAQAPVSEQAPGATAMPPTEAAPSGPPVKTGMVRMYHGGEDVGQKGPMWFTSDPAYARDYAAKTGGKAQVYYVDVPEDYPAIAPEYPEQSIKQGFHLNVELPAEIARRRKILEPASPQIGQQKVTPQKVTAVPPTPTPESDVGPAGKRPRLPALTKAPPSLFQFIRLTGGIKDEGGEVAAIAGGKTTALYRSLVRKNGKSPDEVRAAAQEAGFMAPDDNPNAPTTSTINELYRLMDDEARGTKRHAAEDIGQAEQRHAEIASENDQARVAEHRRAIDEAHKALGLAAMSDEEHAIAVNHVVAGMDPETALEHAAIQYISARETEEAGYEHAATAPTGIPEDRSEGPQAGQQEQPSPAGPAPAATPERPQPGPTGEPAGQEGAQGTIPGTAAEAPARIAQRQRQAQKTEAELRGLGRAVPKTAQEAPESMPLMGGEQQGELIKESRPDRRSATEIGGRPYDYRNPYHVAAGWLYETNGNPQQAIAEIDARIADLESRVATLGHGFVQAEVTPLESARALLREPDDLPAVTAAEAQYGDEQPMTEAQKAKQTALRAREGRRVTRFGRGMPLGEPTLKESRETVPPEEIAAKFGQQRAQIIEEMGKVLERIGPKGTEARAILGDNPLGRTRTAGAFDPARNLIEVSLDAKNPIRTLRHEIIHALYTGGFFTEAEWSALQARAMNDWMTRYDIKARYPELSTADQHEEAIADAFSDYQRGGRTDPPGLRRIWQRLIDLLKGIAGVLKDHDITAAIFEKIESGQVRDRTARAKDLAAGLNLTIKEARSRLQPVPRRDLGEVLTEEEQRALGRMGGKIGEPPEKSIGRKLLDTLDDRLSDRFKQSAIDRAHGFAMLEKAANDGLLREGAQSATKLAHLKAAIGDMVHAALTIGVPHWDQGTVSFDSRVMPPMQILERAGDRAMEFQKLLAAGSAEDRDKINRARIEKKAREGGWSGEKLAAALQDYEDNGRLFKDDEIAAANKLMEVYPDFRDLREKWNDYNKRLLDFYQQSGMIDDNSRRLFETLHRNYVPFNRVMEDPKQHSGPPARMGFQGQHPNFWRQKGSMKNVKDLYQNAEANIARGIEAAINTVVMLRAEQDNAATGFRFFTPVSAGVGRTLVSNRTMLSDLRKQGLEITAEDMEEAGVDMDAVRALWSLGAKPKGEVISWLRDGKVRYATNVDPLFYRAATQINARQNATLRRILAPGRVAKHLLTAAVGLDPSYQFANWLRDAIHIWQVYGKGVPFGVSIKGTAARLMGDPQFQEFLAAGGGMSAMFETAGGIGRMGHLRSRARALTGQDEAGPLTKMVRTANDAIGMLQHFESTFEYGSRFGIYKKLVKEGKSRAEAAWQARDAATDFARRGDSPLLNALIDTLPFFNAGIQGLYRTYVGAGSPGGLVTKQGRAARGKAGLQDSFANATRFAMKGMMLSALSMAMFFRWKDDDRYKELTDYQKDMYWHWWIGDTHYKFPKPFETGTLFGTIPERLTQLAIDHNGAKFGQRLAWNIQNQFRLDPTPQIIRPVVDIAFNWDSFANRYLVPPWLEQGRLPAEQYDATTPLSAIAMGRTLGYSPKKVEHLIDGYLGALGSYIMSAVDFGMRTLGDFPPAPSPRWSDFPVVARVVGEKVPSSTQYLDDFYQMRDDIERTYGSIQATIGSGEAEYATKLMQENAPKLALRGAINDLNSQLQRINQTLRAVKMMRGEGGAFSDEKRALMDRLALARNSIARASAGIHDLYVKAQ